MITYEAFSIVKFDPEKMKLQGETHDGKKREFGLVVHRHLVTNEISFDVVPHFTDPESVPVFEDSDPWDASEVRNG